MQESLGFRAARAAMFAATCVLLAALGHVVMSGTAVPWWAVVGGAGSIATAAWIVADGERDVPFVVLATLVAQAALHTVFTLAQSTTPSMAQSMTASPAMHDHMTGQMTGQMTGTSSLGMLAAHLLAALLCGLWLAYGERAAFAVLRSVAGLVLLPLRLLASPRITAHRPRIQAGHSPTAYTDLLLGHAVTSRGPPRGAAAF
ncbi:hypothetical protein ABZX12_08645 [Kribbella sp. NPDC003505]|uniref:hypothetical protein n=1 Tax=Kribbella sp. NPDC003505 TaxID=3154448 RepID=UPI00339EF3A0